MANRLVASVRGRNERLLGFGPPLHRVDPRVAPLVEIAEQLGLVTRWVSFAREVERVLQEQSRRPLPINVDGIIAALMLEMGLDFGGWAKLCFWSHEPLASRLTTSNR